MSSRVCPGSARQSQITSAYGGITFAGSCVCRPVGVTVIRVIAGNRPARTGCWAAAHATASSSSPAGAPIPVERAAIDGDQGRRRLDSRAAPGPRSRRGRGRCRRRPGPRRDRRGRRTAAAARSTCFSPIEIVTTRRPPASSSSKPPPSLSAQSQRRSARSRTSHDMPTSAVLRSSSASAIEDDVARPGPRRPAELGEGGDAGGELPLHVGGAAADHPAVADLGAERRQGPVRIGRRDDVGVGHEHDRGAAAGALDPGDQVEAVGVGADQLALDPRRGEVVGDQLRGRSSPGRADSRCRAGSARGSSSTDLVAQAQARPTLSTSSGVTAPTPATVAAASARASAAGG